MAASAHGAERTVIANSTHPAPPSQSDVHYEVKCSTHRYDLSINYQRDEVRFKVDDVVRGDDLAASPLGVLMRSREFFGHFGFSCSAKGLSLTFLGFNINGSTPPQPIEYMAVIGDDGQVLMNTGLQPTTLLFIQKMWSGARPAP